MRTKLKLFILAIAATFPMAVVANAGFDDTIGQSQTDRTNADPFIFVHGNAADRIVGFNNDGPTGIAPNLDMSFTKESRISQIYNIATTGISLMNASSQAPDASMKICEIITQPKTSTIYGIAAPEDENCPDFANITSADRAAGINGITDNKVSMVSVFDMSGTLLRSFNLSPDQDIMSEMKIGIPTPGIYLITRVRDNESPNGMSTKSHSLSGDPIGSPDF